VVVDHPRPDGRGWVDPDDVRRTIERVVSQTTERWSLSVTIVGSSDAAMDGAITEALTAAPPGRVRMHTQPEGTEVAAAYAAAMEESTSPAVAFLEPGDELAPDAVAQLSAALVDADVAYADEDRIASDGLVSAPILKPDWSPELLVSWCYLGRPVALRVAPVVTAGGIRSVLDGDWEHDLLLRVTERTPRVAHVPDVLCHRRGAARSAGPAAVVDTLSRRGERARVEPGPLPSTWSVRRTRGVGAGRTTLSAIVPFVDSTTLLRRCAESLRAGAADSEAGADPDRGIDLELVLVDNGSTEPETATVVEMLVDRLSPDVHVVVRRDARPFNWSALNNAAAAGSRGEVLLFVNDDVQGGTPGWMELLVAQALRPEVGAVGARLVYPNGQLQHAGIVLGLAGAAGHVLAGLEPGKPGYLGLAALARDVSAVTGACLATRRDVFEQLGGFDEALGLDFNDVDYCLRARRRGLRVVFEPGAELVHLESPSRGTSLSEETAAAFMARWGALVEGGDPFYNRRLSHVDFSAALDEPWPVLTRRLRSRARRAVAGARGCRIREVRRGADGGGEERGLMDRGQGETAPGEAGERTGTGGTGDRGIRSAPRLLSHRAEPSPLPSPLRETDEIASLHIKFARLVSGATGEAPPAVGTSGGGGGAGGAGGGVRAKVRARVAAVARADAGADREFIGSIVRAVAALADRVDEITRRVGHLELLVEDVVDRLSEDLVRVLAALGALDQPQTLERPRPDDVKSPPGTHG
jgi:GT2 family glycosyltransferase